MNHFSTYYAIGLAPGDWFESIAHPTRVLQCIIPGITVAFFFHALAHGNSLRHLVLLKMVPTEEVLPPPGPPKWYPIG
jgi:hypothetical protein